MAFVRSAGISFFVLVALAITIWHLASFEGASALGHPLELPPDLKVLVSPTLKNGEYTITYVTRSEITISRKPLGTHASTFGHSWHMYLPVRQIEELKLHFAKFRELKNLSKKNQLLPGVEKPIGRIGLYLLKGIPPKEFDHIYDEMLTGCGTFKILFKTPDQLVFEADRDGYWSHIFKMTVDDTFKLETLLDQLSDFRDRFIRENQERLKAENRALNILDKK